MSRSDGSTADYYELPEGATQLQDLISHRNLNAQLGEIFRACYRFGMADHSDQLRDAKKILFYAKAEVERLEKLLAKAKVDLGIEVRGANRQFEPAQMIDDDSPRAQILGQNGEMASEVYAAIDGRMSWDNAPEWAEWLTTDSLGASWWKGEPDWHVALDRWVWVDNITSQLRGISSKSYPRHKEPRPCQ